MPIYEYKCESCGKVEEILMKFSDPDPIECSSCAGPVKKLISHSSFALKGGGWYASDYGKSYGGTFDDTKSPDYRARCEGVGASASESSSDSKPSTPASTTAPSSPAPAPSAP